MDDDRIEVKTYREFWHAELTITNIEGHQIPMALTVKKIFYFLFTALIFHYLVKIPGISLILKIEVLANPLVFYSLLPGIATYYLNKLKIDGKQPYIYIIDMVVFLLTPKRYEFFKVVKIPISQVIKETIRYRCEVIISIFEFDKEKSLKDYQYCHKYI